MSPGPLSSASPLNRGALAAAVRSGVPTLGTFIGSASPVTAEVCAAAGVDWVLLDLEHGAGGEEQVRDVVAEPRGELQRAHRGPGRIRGPHPGWDGSWTAGPRASCCPASDTADEVAEAVGAPALPAGRRPGRGHLQPGLPVGGLDPGALKDRANDEFCSAWPRSSRRPRSATQAARSPSSTGMDVLFVGPRDLSHDLGVPGDLARRRPSYRGPSTRHVMRAPAGPPRPRPAACS